MKKAFFKSLILVLALVLTLSFAAAFSACNKHKTPPAPDTSREDARNEFVSIVMLSRDNAWSPDLVDEEIAVIDNAGDYIVALKWTEFVANVLYESGLQTGKIEKINAVLSSEKGKELIENIEKKQHDYIPVLKDMGLTEEDVEEIVFDGIVGIFEKSEGIFNDCISRAENVKLISQNGKARTNLDNVISSAKRSKDAILSADAEELKGVLNGVENEIKSIVGFSYNTALLFAKEGDSNLIKTLTSGALEDANVNELALYLESAFESVEELKSQLSEESVSQIGNALGLIIDKMEGVTVTSEVFSSIVNTMRFVYAFMDFLPYVCDYIGSVGEYITSSDNEYKNLQTLIDAYFDDDYVGTYDDSGNIITEGRANLSVPVFNMILTVFGVDYSTDDSLATTKVSAKNKIDDLLTEMGTRAQNDYKKSVVLVYFDVLFQGDGESAYIVKLNERDTQKISGIIAADITVGSFKNAYAKYARDNTDRKGLVNSVRIFNEYLGTTSLKVPDEVTYDWFKSVLNAVRDKLSADTASIVECVVDNLKVNVDSLFDAYFDNVVEIAKMDIAKVGTPEHIALVETIKSLGIIKLFCK